MEESVAKIMHRVQDCRVRFRGIAKKKRGVMIVMNSP